MLVRRKVFEAAGGFDERYFCYFEDVDLCFRLRLGGARVVQLPDAVVAHVGGGVISGGSAFAQFHGARNRLWTFVKCMPAPLFWPLLPAHLLASAAVVTLSLLRGRGFAAWRGLFAALGDLGPALRARREVQNARKATTGDIARALAWSPFVFFGRQPVIKPRR
jgi:GT2 family glycosyltransferase